MGISHWVFNAAVAAIGIFSSGPAMLLAISNSIRFGLRRVLYSSLGNVAGVLCVWASAVLGLGAIFKSSALRFGALKILAAGYLIFLCIKQWRGTCNCFHQGTICWALDC